MDSYPNLLDPASPEVRVDFGLAEAEFARQRINAASAAQIAAVHSVLQEARAYPSVFVGPHADPDNREHIEFAERAAIADLAVRLCVAENTIRAWELQAATLVARAPRTWMLFRDGQVSAANARVIADLAATLPTDDLWSEFDTAVADLATRLAPARFAARARAIRERLHSRAANERHRARMEERHVRLEPGLDGMVWMTAHLPADVAVKGMARIDAEALRLNTALDETRTLDQLRADILGDLLIGRGPADGPAGRSAGGPGVVGVRVGVVVPVMTLLGLSEEPATLEGYGPIDAETARRLTADAPSFYRVLTDPITSTVLDIDRVTLRVPADMKRFLRQRHPTCVFPGCGRNAARCDLDHTVDRQYGGTTRVDNLAPLCRNHHRVKHNTGWTVTQERSGVMRWSSPTGHTHDSDPPPF